MKLLIIIFLAACSDFDYKGVSDFEKTQTFFLKKESLENVKKVLKVNDDPRSEYIDFKSEENFRVFIFFNDLDRVDEMLYTVYPNDLESFLENVKCNWNSKEEYRSSNNGHVVRLVKEGRCSDKNISYQYVEKSGWYEIRWKHNYRDES